MKKGSGGGYRRREESERFGEGQRRMECKKRSARKGGGGVVSRRDDECLAISTLPLPIKAEGEVGSAGGDWFWRRGGGRDRPREAGSCGAGERDSGRITLLPFPYDEVRNSSRPQRYNLPIPSPPAYADKAQCSLLLSLLSTTTSIGRHEQLAGFATVPEGAYRVSSCDHSPPLRFFPFPRRDYNRMEQNSARIRDVPAGLSCFSCDHPPLYAFSLFPG
ncbi:hypothetical protein KI387_012303, partial [Taxus chinensis]